MGVPLCVICCFSLVDFNIFSLIFVSLTTVCLYVLFLLELILYGTLCASWTWVSFPSHDREVFSDYLLKYSVRLLIGPL